MDNKLIIKPSFNSGRGEIIIIRGDQITRWCPDEHYFSVRFYELLSGKFPTSEFMYYFYDADQMHLAALYTAIPGCPVTLITGEEL